ncbi:hypothetical protein [Roseateles sp. P5_E4]
MRKWMMGLAAAWLVVLTGCASKPQNPVPLNKAAIGGGSGKVGVVMTALPKVDTEFPGAGCLLCLGVANAAHSTLTGYVRTLPLEDLATLKDQAASFIVKSGGSATALATDLKLDDLPKFSGDAVNFARQDFRGLRDKHGVDRLLVIQINALGVWRNYSAYVPTAEPKAVFKGVAYMVDLRTNALDWYKPIDINKAAAATAWDQPPKFPGLTNAYFEALELGKDAVLKPLQ